MNFRPMLIPMMMLVMSCSVIDKDAHEIFADRKGPFEVTVYPVHIVVSESTFADTVLQMDLVHFLNESGLAIATPATRDVEIPFTWGANQAKMFSRSAKGFAHAISMDRPATDYALLVESLSIGSEENVGGVHFYLVDKHGKIAAGSLSNSHWDEFTSISPRGRHAAMKVAYNLLGKLSLETL